MYTASDGAKSSSSQEMKIDDEGDIDQSTVDALHGWYTSDSIAERGKRLQARQKQIYAPLQSPMVNCDEGAEKSSWNVVSQDESDGDLC